MATTLPRLQSGKNISQKQTQGLSPIQIRALAKVFANADLDYDGKVDRDELHLLLEEMGYVASLANVNAIMDLLDTDGDGVITQAEFLAGSATTHNIVNAAPKIDTPRNTRDEQKGKKGTKAVADGQLEASLKAFLDENHVFEPWVLDFCVEDGMTLKELIELSYDPHHINGWMTEAGLGIEAKRRVTRSLSLKRNFMCYHSKKVAIVVSVGAYDNGFVCQPRSAGEDGAFLVDALTSQGYAAHYLHTTSEEKGSQPTTMNILMHIRAVGAALATYDENELDQRTVLLFLIGNGIRDQHGETYFMPKEFEMGKPIHEGMAVNSLLSLLPGNANVCYFVDMGVMYDYKKSEVDKPQYALQESDSQAIVALSPIDLFRFQQPSGGGLLTSHMVQCLKKESKLLASDFTTFLTKQKWATLKAPMQGRSKGKEFDTVCLQDGPTLKYSASPQVHVSCVLDGTGNQSIDNESQQVTQSLLREAGSLSYVDSVYTGMVGIVLKGDLKTATQPGGSWSKVASQINHLTGTEDPSFVVKQGWTKGEWVLVVSIGFASQLNESASGDGAQVRNLNVVHQSKRRVTGNNATKGKKPTSTKRPAKPKAGAKPAAAAPSPPPEADSPKHSAEHLKLVKKCNDFIASLSPMISNGQLQIGGLDVTMAGLYHDLHYTVNIDDSLKLEAAFKKGSFATSRVMSCRVLPQRPEPNAGVISHSGTDIYVAMLNAAAQASIESIQHQLLHEPSQVEPEERIVEHNIREGRTKELFDLLRECRSGDIVEISGKWKGPLTLDRAGVTLRAKGPTTITNDGDKSVALIFRGNCRAIGFTIISTNDQPAVSVEFGAPEILKCDIHSKKGVGINCRPLVDPVVRGCNVHDCGKAGVVIDGGMGWFLETSFDRCAMGATMCGQPMMNGPLFEECSMCRNEGVGIMLEKQAQARFRGCTISRNKTPGIILEKDAYAAVYRCYIRDNESCGIRILEYSGIRLEDSELSGNIENEIIIDRANTRPVQFFRNRFYKTNKSMKSAEVAIDLTNAKPVIHGNDFEGYRVCVLVRGACRDTKIQLNRSSPMKDPDSLLIRDSSKYDNVEKGNVQFNEFYKEGPADPLHLSNRNLPITSYGLLEATAAGYCSVVRRLIADGANPNIPGKENPLLMAARAQAEAMVLLLLDSKCNPNVQDSSGWTPLHCAMSGYNLPLVRMLLDNGADCHIADSNGLTPVLVALDSAFIPGLQLLVSNTPARKSEFGGRGINPKKVDPDATVKSGHTLMATAARLGKVQVMDLLLECQADINLGCETNNETPLYMATRYGQVEAMKWLLDRGADPNVQTTEGDCPLIMSTGIDSASTVHLLLDKGADVRMETSLRHFTALHLAASLGNLAFIQVLVDKGADANARTKLGRTPLHLAAMFRQPKAVALLLKSGADRTIEDSEGCTALMYAQAEVYDMLVDHHEEKLMKWCLSTESKVPFEKALKHASAQELSKKNFRGISLFYQSVLFGNRSAAAFLQEKHAEGNTSNKEGVSAYLWASWAGGDAMHKMMENYTIKKKNRDVECIQRLEEAAKESPGSADIVKWSLAFCMKVQSSAPDGWILNPTFPYPQTDIVQLRTWLEECIDNITYEGVTKINFKGGEGTLFDYLDNCRIYAKPPISNMDQLLWDARYHVMNRVCNGDRTPAVHQFVLNLFSQPREIYEQVFKAFKTTDAEALALWSPLLQALHAALKDVSTKPAGPVYMVHTSLLEPPLNRSSIMPPYIIPFQPGTQINFNAPTWATEDAVIAQGMSPPEHGTLFVIHGKTCKNISQWSCHPQLGQVLFEAGSSFVIDKVYQNGDKEYAIWRKGWVARVGPSRMPAVVVEMTEL
uniref:Probable pectate lyase C n=1 Tax=Eutreptiella gymnastica TaxID=73025 RepID=A0A7S1IR73_9EUGL|mmetsp:Transcript_3709/g.6556  ORF Transcript_3709/g.6556 Transcript_3709/m.6556 type:complete len:1844 (+) Transcript_3709:109-5640(+)